MPSSTYTLIKGETLASAAASYTFTAIPSTFTDLVVRASIRTDAGSPNVLLRINGATSGFSDTAIRGTGSAANSLRDTAASNYNYGGIANGTSSTSDTFTNLEWYIPSYTASQNKPSSAIGAYEDNATAAYITAVANLWSNTAAVTQLLITQGSGNLVAGSSFYLYGISKS